MIGPRPPWLGGDGDGGGWCGKPTLCGGLGDCRGWGIAIRLGGGVSASD